MNRQTQSLLLLILGGALLNISAFSTDYVNYVKPGFRPLLIGAGAVLVVLALVSLVRAVRGRATTHDHAHEAAHEDEGGHDHGRGPRVAWLLAVPVFAIVTIAPPALGSFAAGREDSPSAPPPAKAVPYRPLAAGGVAPLAMGEFIGRAYDPSDTSLAGQKVKLTGFVVTSAKKKRWYVARMQMSCCAADALALKVAVEGVPAPRENSWVEVTGTWIPWKGKIPNGYVIPAMTVTDVTKIDQPAEPYE
ncbi:TIGR03943 family putative permease subunit [Nonomuraea sp. NPDC050022]|uniref:TIGR03943 family putative permease subunit n=1 Tax=unclassified Nonomuraea TaxID=2593643 RepID=UPI0033EE22A6